MKTVLLMRHAKSSWDDEGLSDHDRPLNQRGLRDAPRMGMFLSGSGVIPEGIISSTANRAQSTAHLVADNCELFSGEVELDESLYHAPPGAYLDRANLLNDSVTCIMFVGHNPGLEEAVSTSAGSYQRFPTGTIAVLDVDVEGWNQIESFQQAMVREIWRPKEIG